MNEDQLTLADHARHLCHFGLSDRSLQELTKLPVKIDNWTRRIRSLLQYKPYRRLFDGQSDTPISAIQWLAEFHHKPIPVPRGYALYAHAAHAESGTPAVYRAAQRQAATFESRLNKYGDFINIAALPEARQTIHILQSHLHPASRLPFAAERRAAAQALRRAVYEPGQLHADFSRKRLHNLLTDLKQILAFSDNTLYTTKLGPAFRGLQTDWLELKQFIKFSQAIRFACPTPQYAVRLISNWEHNQADLIAASKKASAVLQELQKLSRLHKQLEHSGDEDPLLPDLLQTASTAQSSINEHLQQLATQVNDDTLTPERIIAMQL